jgi:hypothetical protein
MATGPVLAILIVLERHSPSLYSPKASLFRQKKNISLGCSKAGLYSMTPLLKHEKKKARHWLEYRLEGIIMMN